MLLTYVANKDDVDVSLVYCDVLLTYLANKDDIDMFLVNCDVLLTHVANKDDVDVFLVRCDVLDHLGLLLHSLKWKYFETAQDINYQCI